jgi:predicted  nucleic acid-binding Zn-ribbon protein
MGIPRQNRYIKCYKEILLSVEGGFNLTSLSPAIDPVIQVDVPFPAIDLLAVMPYVIPLIFGAIVFALYQRHLRRASLERNIMLSLSIAGFVVAFLLVLYAGFGSVWWWRDDFTLGSWRYLIGYLQFGTDLIFSSVITGVIYLVIACVVFAAVATRVIAPPDPDFVSLREELETKSRLTESLTEKVQFLEAENKELNEFLSEREENLVSLERELDSLKQSIAEREKELEKARLQLEKAAESIETTELEKRITEKNEQIQSLENEISDLHSTLEKKTTEVVAPAEMEGQVKALRNEIETLKKRLEDMRRRTETANEVSDSLISDLAELISDIENSSLDDPTKKSLVALVENLGRAMGRVSTTSADVKAEQPQVELIGAVLMMHEIIDGIKRIAR